VIIKYQYPSNPIMNSLKPFHATNRKIVKKKTDSLTNWMSRYFIFLIFSFAHLIIFIFTSYEIKVSGC